jgi:hypothetical protein
VIAARIDAAIAGIVSFLAPHIAIELFLVGVVGMFAIARWLSRHRSRGDP